MKYNIHESTCASVRTPGLICDCPAFTDEMKRRREEGDRKNRALDVQEGGDHYKKLAIQPAQFVHANRIPYLEGSVIYYVTRWRDKNGIADLRKARHTIDLIIEMEERENCLAQNKPT